MLLNELRVGENWQRRGISHALCVTGEPVVHGAQRWNAGVHLWFAPEGASDGPQPAERPRRAVSGRRASRRLCRDMGRSPEGHDETASSDKLIQHSGARPVKPADEARPAQRIASARRPGEPEARRELRRRAQPDFGAAARGVERSREYEELRIGWTQKAQLRFSSTGGRDSGPVQPRLPCRRGKAPFSPSTSEHEPGPRCCIAVWPARKVPWSRHPQSGRSPPHNLRHGSTSRCLR